MKEFARGLRLDNNKCVVSVLILTQRCSGYVRDTATGAALLRGQMRGWHCSISRYMCVMSCSDDKFRRCAYLQGASCAVAYVTACLARAVGFSRSRCKLHGSPGYIRCRRSKIRQNDILRALDGAGRRPSRHGCKLCVSVAGVCS